jgi:hypothetical protein
MKQLIFFASVISILINFAFAKSGFPKEWGMARMLTSSLYNNELSGGKRIPDTWEDMVEISWTRSGKISQSAYYIKLVNSFALVPTSPVIKKDSKIPNEYSGKRLFLISRYQIYTASSTQGRCMILIDPPSAESGRIISAPYFVPEATAQLIIAQIPDFDPTEQPLAFDDDFLLANKNKFQGEHLDSTIRAIEKNKQAEARSDNPQKQDIVLKKDKDRIQKKLQKIQAEKDANPLFRNFTTWLVIGVILILGIISWRLMNRIKTRKVRPIETNKLLG